MKKVCYIFVLLAALMNINAVFAQGAMSGKINNTVSWSYDSGTKTLAISGSGAMDNYDERTFTPWKEYSAAIEKIEFADGITSIGDYSFTFCEKVKEINLPDSVTKIGKAAFGWCYGLENIQLSRVEEISEMAFVWCKSIKTLHIPVSVSKIDPGILHWSMAFKEFDVSAENPNYTDVDGVLYNKDKTILVSYPCAYAKTFSVPEGVEEIAQDAFLGTFIQSVTFPYSLKQISARAFMGCMSLQEAVFKTGPEMIGQMAFSNCTSLTKIDIPEGCQIIGENAFAACKNLEYIILPKSVTQIANGAISGAEIKGIPNSYANRYANENGLYFSSTVRVILNGAAMEFDSAPIIVNGYTLVPMRKIFEALGAEVTWDMGTNTATGRNGDTTVSIQIGSDTLYKNGQGIALNVPAQLIRDRTLVPLRAISESFNVTVEWNPDDFVVTLIP